MRASWPLLVALAACGNSPGTDKSSGPAAETAEAALVHAATTDAAPDDPLTDSASATWHRIAIDDLEISLDVFAGDGIEQPSVSEGYLVQSNGPMTISVAWGTDVGIAAWQRTAGGLPGQTASAVADVHICGKPRPHRDGRHPRPRHH